jgi:tetratricopeptide (TPR) repeat protein
MFDLQERLSFAFSLRELLVVAGLALVFVPIHARAQYKYEQSLMHMLPSYCRYTQDFINRFPGSDRVVEQDRWKRSMGPTFIHLHHYCYGLMDVNRAELLAADTRDRLFNLSNSLLEFDYVIDKSPLDFPLLPEILTKKSESLIKLSRPGEAMIELQRAIKVKPAYEPAYAVASDYYKSTQQIAKAREWLEKGISAAPNSKTLRQRLAELNRQSDKGKATPELARKPLEASPD